MPVAHVIVTSMDIVVGGISTRLPIICTLMEEGRSLMLFDTGYWGSQELTAGLSRLRLAPRDVTHVFLTHFHGDHAGGTDLFSDAVKIASRRENDFSRNWLKGFVGAPDPYRYIKGFFPYLPDAVVRERADMLLDHSRHVPQYWWDGILEGYVWIEDGPDLPGGVTVISTPGHTPHHTSYLVGGKRGAVLVAGDAMSRRGAGGNGSLLDEPHLDLAAYKKSVDTLRSIPAFVIPAHDRPFLQGGCTVRAGKRVEF